MSLFLQPLFLSSAPLGGAAECVVAARLVEDPNVKVLILEAGYTDESLTLRAPGLAFAKFESKDDCNLSTSRRPLLQPRRKMLGSSSA